MAGIPLNTTKFTLENCYPIPILPALEQSLIAKQEANKRATNNSKTIFGHKSSQT